MPVLGEVEAFPVGCKNREEALKMKAYYFEVMGYDYSFDQDDPDPSRRGTTKRFHQSDAPIRIVTAPARGSKSYSASPEVCAGIMPTEPRTNSMTWIVGIDYPTNKEFVYCWEHLIERRARWNGIYRVDRAVNNPSQGNMIIRLDVGVNVDTGERCYANIVGKSSTNERALQGEALTYGLLSEAAEHESRIWTKYLSSRTWRAIMPTTPKIKAEWIREMIDAGERDPTLGIDHFNFSRYANPLYDHTRFERERRLAEGRSDTGRAEDDPFFAEQFLGHWVYYTGRVLPFDDHHILTLKEEMFEGASFYVSTDYGYEDACVALFWLQSHRTGALCIFDEVYDRHLVTEDFVSAIVEKLAARGLSPDDLSYACGDPKQPQVAEYLSRMGFTVSAIDKLAQCDRALGHRRLVDLLADDPELGQPMLYVADHCHKTINEWRKLHYRDGMQNEYGANAWKGADHCFHPDTEMLTEGGWKPVGKVIRGERVATRTEGGALEWHPVTETVRNHYEGDLIEWDGGRGGSFRVTPNHRLLVASQFQAKRGDGRTHFVEVQEFESAETLPPGHSCGGDVVTAYWIPTFHLGCVPGEGLDASDFSYFLGFYLAEGCRSTSTSGCRYVHVDQKARAVLDKIKNFLGGSISRSKNGMHRLSIANAWLFELLGEKQLSYQKRIPRWFFDRANIDEHEALFKGMMDGDGTWSQYKYDTTSPGMADDFMELLARLGYCGNIYSYQPPANIRLPQGRMNGNPHRIYRVKYRRPETSHRYFRLEQSMLKRVPYSGETVCVVVPPNHSVLSRLNGKSLWIGQSADAARYLVTTMPEAHPEEFEYDWLRDHKRRIATERHLQHRLH